MSKEEHKRLCEIGEKFLKRPLSANGHGCHFAIREAMCYGESPDVFGIRHGQGDSFDTGTVIIEVKVSRSDFLADKKKPFRLNPDKGMGKWRYYMCPEGLIQPAELPPRWGLLYVNKRGHVKPVWGAINLQKETYTDYHGNKRKFIPWGQKEEHFPKFAFSKRNIQNEQNLLTMALCRLDDVEDKLYLVREVGKLQTKGIEYQQKIHNLEKENSSLGMKIWRLENK